MSTRKQRKRLARQIKDHGLASVEFQPEFRFGFLLSQIDNMVLPTRPIRVAVAEAGPRPSLSFYGKAFEPKSRVEVFPRPKTEDKNV